MNRTVFVENATPYYSNNLSPLIRVLHELYSKEKLQRHSTISTSVSKCNMIGDDRDSHLNPTVPVWEVIHIIYQNQWTRWRLYEMIKINNTFKSTDLMTA